MNQEIKNLSNLNKATVLLVTNHHFLGLEKFSSSQYYFCFKQTEGLEQTLEAFINGKLRIDPRTFIEANKYLKQALEEAKRV